MGRSESPGGRIGGEVLEKQRDFKTLTLQKFLQCFLIFIILVEIKQIELNKGAALSCL